MKTNKVKAPTAVSIAKVTERINAGRQSVFDTCCSECDLALGWMASNKLIVKNDAGQIRMAPKS